MGNSILFENVNKKYGDKIIFQNQSFSLSNGITFLVGKNGAGKSTLIKLAMGIENADSGNIELFSKNVSKISKIAKKKLGLQLQNDAFLRGIKVKEYIKLYSEIYRSDISPRYSVEYIYDLLEIESIKNNYAYTLSGGEKKRVSFMLTIIGNKELIILDEPTAGIDVEIKDKIVSAILYLKSKGTNILVASHDLDDFFEISDNILMLDEGIIFDGTKNKFFEKYNYKYKVISDKNILDTDILSCDIFTSKTLYSKKVESLNKYFSEDMIKDIYPKDLYQIAIKLGGKGEYE